MDEIKKINFKTLDNALTEYLKIPSTSISDELKDSRLIELNTIVLGELGLFDWKDPNYLQYLDMNASNKKVLTSNIYVAEICSSELYTIYYADTALSIEVSDDFTLNVNELFFMKNKSLKQNNGLATIKIKLISEN